MAINIISKIQNMGGKYDVRFEMADGYVFFLEYTTLKLNAELKDDARDAYEKIKDAAQQLHRANRVAARIAKKVSDAGLDVLAAAQVDAEGLA